MTCTRQSVYSVESDNEREVAADRRIRSLRREEMRTGTLRLRHVTSKHENASLSCLDTMTVKVTMKKSRHARTLTRVILSVPAMLLCLVCLGACGSSPTAPTPTPTPTPVPAPLFTQSGTGNNG